MWETQGIEVIRAPKDRLLHSPIAFAIKFARAQRILERRGRFPATTICPRLVGLQLEECGCKTRTACLRSRDRQTFLAKKTCRPCHRFDRETDRSVERLIPEPCHLRQRTSPALPGVSRSSYPWLVPDAYNESSGYGTPPRIPTLPILRPE